MKRSTPPKRSKSPKVKRKGSKTTPSTRQVKSKLWEATKALVRERYRNPDGTWNCFTCGRLIDSPTKAQTGHFIPRASGGALLYYHLDNLRIQDYYCNINLGGNGAEYYRRLIAEIGQERVDQLFTLKNQTMKADIIFYTRLLNEYKQLINS